MGLLTSCGWQWFQSHQYYSFPASWTGWLAAGLLATVCARRPLFCARIRRHMPWGSCLRHFVHGGGCCASVHSYRTLLGTGSINVTAASQAASTDSGGSWTCGCGQCMIGPCVQDDQGASGGHRPAIGSHAQRLHVTAATVWTCSI